MLGQNKRTEEKRIHLDEAAAALPNYDLLGLERSRVLAEEALSEILEPVRQKIEDAGAHLFSDAECRLEMSPFSTLERDDEAHESALWIKAENPDGVMVVMAMDAQGLYQLAELFFGGGAISINANRTNVSQSLTDSEKRLLVRLLSLQLKHIGDRLGIEEEWRIGRMPRAPQGDDWLSSNACIFLGEHQASWQLWWPIAKVQPKAVIEEQKIPDLTPELEQAAENIPVQLRIILANTRLTLDQLTRLNEGDVIPVDMPEIVTALAGPQSFVKGKMAERNGHLVLQVSDVYED